MKLLLSVFFFLLLQKTSAQLTDSSTTNHDTAFSKNLKEVIILSGKRPIEVVTDKTVLHIEAQPAAIGETALDVLRRSPGVVVDAAETIQMNGKSGVMVFIDGKNTQLTAQDLAQLLKSIEGSNIKQIELITAPSAKWDAAGNAGVINIKLKKSLTNGFNGNISASHVQSTHARQTAGVNFNWRKNKTVLFFNGSLRNGLQHTIAHNTRSSGNRHFTQHSIEKDFFGGSSLRAGIDYAITKRSTLGFLWMNNYKYTRMDNNSTSVLHLPTLQDTTITTRSVAPFPSYRNAVNLNYAFTNGRTEYAIDADYTVFKSSVKNQIFNGLKNASGQKLGENQTVNNQQVKIKLAAIKGDLTTTLSPKLKLETGFKLAPASTNNSLAVDNHFGSAWVTDTGKTNTFYYDETVLAAYASLKHSGKKIAVQLGLRGEHTTANGQSIDLKQVQNNRPDTNYLNIFPTFYFQYQPAQHHQLGIMANRRIDRPSYQDQNPFIYMLDALNSEQGNPYLTPQFTNSLELSYTYKYATSLKITYSKTTAYIENLTYQNGNFTVMIPQNAGTRQLLHFSLNTPVAVSKKWNVYLSLSPYYHYYQVALVQPNKTEKQSGESWGFNGYASNTIQLGKGFTGSVSGWFNFQNRATIYTSKPLGSLDIGLQKNVLKEKATLKISLVDVLNTQRWEQRAVTSDLVLNTHRKWESQNITLGISWRFGNAKIKKAQERETGTEEEAKRIK